MKASIGTQKDIILEYNKNNCKNNYQKKTGYKFVPNWQCYECTIINNIDKCVLCGCNSPYVTTKLKPKKLFI